MTCDCVQAGLEVTEYEDDSDIAPDQGISRVPLSTENEGSKVEESLNQTTDQHM